jgi:hypothetical protein
MKFRRNDRIRTTYYHSQTGRIVRYEPIPSHDNPGTVMEWYIVRFDDRDRADACIHASMMNRANEPR